MRIAAAIIGLFLVINSRAEAAYISAETLLRDCNAKIGDLTGSDINFQRCLWYIGGIHDAMQDSGVIAANGRKACFPHSLIVGDLIRPVVEFIRKLKNPDNFGAGGAVIVALTTTYPCNENNLADGPHPKEVEMVYLRANISDFAGQAIKTSGYIRCVASLDNCTVESEPTGLGLMPYLYFNIVSLSANDRALFLSKCGAGTPCFFSGTAVVDSEKYGQVQLKPSRVVFKTLFEQTEEQMKK